MAKMRDELNAFNNSWFRKEVIKTLKKYSFKDILLDIKPNEKDTLTVHMILRIWKEFILSFLFLLLKSCHKLN